MRLKTRTIDTENTEILLKWRTLLANSINLALGRQALQLGS